MHGAGRCLKAKLQRYIGIQIKTCVGEDMANKLNGPTSELLCIDGSSVPRTAHVYARMAGEFGRGQQNRNGRVKLVDARMNTWERSVSEQSFQRRSEGSGEICAAGAYARAAGNIGCGPTDQGMGEYRSEWTG